MTRTARRRTLRLESLEGRRLMAADSLSPEAAETIALTNAARANPAAITQWALSDPGIQDTLTYYGVDPKKFVGDMQQIASRPPLAWTSSLDNAAQAQSNYEAQVGQQTHIGANGADLGTRLNAAGYTGASSAAENTYAFAQDANNAIRSFLIDWGVPDLGHRVNMLQPNASAPSFNEVGVGITQTSNKGLGPQVVTMDFGRHDNIQPYLLGFAYAQDATGYYKAGQGQAGVQVQIQQLAANGNPTGTSQTVTTDGSGAYEAQLAPGTYKVTATLNGKLVHATTVTLGSDNVEWDIKMNGSWDTPQPAPTVPPPAPTVTPATQVVQPSTAPPAASGNSNNEVAAAQATFQASDANQDAANAAPPDVVAQAIEQFGDISLTALNAYSNINFSSIQGFSAQG